MTFAQDDQGRAPRPAGPVADEGGPAGGQSPSSTPPSSTPPAGGGAPKDAEGRASSPADDRNLNPSEEGEGPSDLQRVETDLSELLSETEQQRDEYLELAKRTQADFENYRKRMAADVQAAATRGKAELAVGLIGVIDNLERALEAAEIGRDGEGVADDPLSQGIALTHRDLCAALERAGVESYDPTGESFDPSWHEALQKAPVDGAEPGTVVEVMQKGYRLGDQVLRAARVVVSE